MNNPKSQEIEIEKLSPRLEQLSKRYPQVIAAYLFGSQACGHPNPLSDIDIGILLRQGLPDMESFSVEMNLLGELQKIFKTNNIDLVVLNKAPLPMQYNATSGKLLFSGNNQKRTDFEEYVRKYYIDCLPIYREYREEFFKRIREGRMPDG